MTISLTPSMRTTEDTPVETDQVADVAALPMTQRLSPQERAIRALNVVVASIVLVLSLPLWLVIAIAIKLTSRGPVLYRQERVGLDVPPRARGPRRRGRPST